ncbi:hypothetical protein COSO111634_06380 [Corallococcus soli]|nr:winged helix-turn-helix transcriptional regulator [Corallococcus soli]
MEYSLTAQGQTLREVILALKHWGEAYLGQKGHKRTLTAVAR